MKRVLFLVMVMGFLLCGCSAQKALPYTVEKDGTIFTVDRENRTVTDGKDVYRYDVEENKITITYPNDATYSWSTSGASGITVGAGGSSGNYDESRYISGRTLTEVLSRMPPESGFDSGRILFGLICLAIGLWNTASPDTAWYFRRGWHYRDAEPSDAALELTRIGGIFAILIGAITFLSGL